MGFQESVVLRSTDVLAIFVFQTMNIGVISIHLFLSLFWQCFVIFTVQVFHLFDWINSYIYFLVIFSILINWIVCDFLFYCLWRIYIHIYIKLFMWLYISLQDSFISPNRKFCVNIRDFVLHKISYPVNNDNSSFVFCYFLFFYKQNLFSFLYFLNCSGKDFLYDVK